jgi:hypothetical protein
MKARSWAASLLWCAATVLDSCLRRARPSHERGTDDGWYESRHARLGPFGCYLSLLTRSRPSRVCSALSSDQSTKPRDNFHSKANRGNRVYSARRQCDQARLGITTLELTPRLPGMRSGSSQNNNSYPLSLEQLSLPIAAAAPDAETDPRDQSAGPEGRESWLVRIIATRQPTRAPSIAAASYSVALRLPRQPR